MDGLVGIGGGVIVGAAVEEVAVCLTVDAVEDVTCTFVGRRGLYG